MRDDKMSFEPPPRHSEQHQKDACFAAGFFAGVVVMALVVFACYCVAPLFQHT